MLQGHGPVHLLLISAADLGFAWDADEQGWVRVSLPPLRMMAGPSPFNIGWSCSTFSLPFLRQWQFHIFSRLSLSRKGFRSVEFADLKGSLQLLNSTHLRDRDKNVVKSHFMWGSLERIPSW